MKGRLALGDETFQAAALAHVAELARDRYLLGILSMRQRMRQEEADRRFRSLSLEWFRRRM